jgi:hypothetical protein
MTQPLTLTPQIPQPSAPSAFSLNVAQIVYLAIEWVFG